ncbi:hypothetical protein DM02DRAFT_698828, partial [Periconia macrospinosa]
VDPFSALSLAGNIVQFLDFGQKLLSKGKEIYKSAEGTTTTHIELELIYDDLWAVSDKLAARAPPSPANYSSDNLTDYRLSIVDDQISQLATSCQTLAQELLSIVRELRVDPGSKHRKWESFRQAMKSLGKKSQIEALQQRLNAFRDEMTIRLVAVLGDQQSLVLQEIQKLSNENIRLDLNSKDRLQDLTKHIDEVHDMIFGRLEGVIANIEREKLVKATSVESDRLAETSIKGNDETTDGFVTPDMVFDKLTKADIINGDRLAKNTNIQRDKSAGSSSIHRDKFTKTTPIDLNELAKKIHDLAVRCREISKEQRILSSLHYPYMYTRMSNVVKAHFETFDWIFEPDCDVGFVQWLERNDGIYWISGKPGSGKSTLMKYLYSHPRTQAALKKWAGETELVTASFFFWSIGTQMQKTQEGLLRSLLLSILKQNHSLIPVACPALWALKDHETFPEDLWTLDQLQITMGAIVEQKQATSKFCFFIDGLDEYAGHPADLFEVLYSLSQSRFVKICASSRPWNVFEDAYGESASTKLYLEQLTRGDIELFVRSKLVGPTRLATLALEDVGFNALVDEIVARAQGVFLWVYLVMLSLCDGLINGDDVRLLQDRLNLIPSDLETFFRLILDSVDVVYKVKMAETFQVIMESSEPLTLITLSFLDQRDLEARLRDPVSAMDNYDIFDRHNKTRRRINGRYKGLLEITHVPSATDYFGYRVDFFHRTVRDFIRSDDI